MEKGFFAPSVGYWQSNDDVPPEILAGYPIDTIEVPLRPSPLHTWDGQGWAAPSPEAWTAFIAVQVRSERDLRVAQNVDPVATNTLRWNSLSAEKQAEWAAYRNALLDITKQPGFPHSVVWPTKPE